MEGASPPSEKLQCESPPSNGAGSEPVTGDSEPQELVVESSGTESTGLHMEGFYTQHCDSASLSSFSLDTPSLSRRPPPQDDTASLVSTGTLVPEVIYLPPPGHRLVTHADWDALQAQVRGQGPFVSELSCVFQNAP